MHMDKDKFIVEIAEKLKLVPNIAAMVLGGSYADGRQRPDSDIDLGLFYREKNPFSIEKIKKLAVELNDKPDPIVSDFNEWGYWINGGTWLTIKGQRTDFIYRNYDLVEKTIDESINGELENDYYQDPPNGFHSFIYLAEIEINKILYDPENLISKLKKRVSIYPQKLKNKIINFFLWDSEFALSRARKFANRKEIHLVAGSITRIIHDLTLVLYALNEIYFFGVKRSYVDIPKFFITPPGFMQTVENISGNIGLNAGELNHSLEKCSNLIETCKLLAKDIYVPKYK